jgi:uncharacterized membrane protein YhiD involved in acid resistance
MNPITLLTNGVDSLWTWTYGIIAGWGLTVTAMVVAVVILLIRTVNLQNRIEQLENRVVANEREFNLMTKTWPGKK